MSNQRVLNKTRLRSGCQGDSAVAITDEGPAEKHLRKRLRWRHYGHPSLGGLTQGERAAGRASVIGWSKVDKFFALLALNRKVESC